MIGTSSGRNLDFLRELGMDEAIEYTTTRIDEVVQDAVVSTVLPLTAVHQAHALSESMHTRGKIVLQIEDYW